MPFRTLEIESPQQTSGGFRVLEPISEVKPETYGAIFPSKPTDTALTAGLKATANVPTSAFTLVKNIGGAVKNVFNPDMQKNTIANIARTVVGGAETLNKKIGTLPNTPPTEREEVFGQLANVLKERYGSLESLQKTATNDPVGFGTDILTILQGGAGALGKTGQLNNALSKTAQVVTKPVAKAAEVGTNTLIKTPTRFAVAQATGLNPETIAKVIDDPAAFTREAQATLDRATLANEIKTKLNERQVTLNETGAGYAPIRESATPIGVGVDWLGSTIKETTGLTLKNGKFEVRPSASIRDAKDVRALQNLYDTYKPLFQRGAMTTNEFLNLRSDLAKLAKFERELTKSQPLENLSAIIRGKLNTDYRSKISGLEDLDNNFGTQIEELNRLKKGILDNKGNLTETGINRIANATGKGKDLLLDRLEEISPGITGKIKTLKAIEDIKAASGQKVGTYARAGGLIGGVVTFNPYLILGSILSMPEVAVPILRGIGMAEQKIAPLLKSLSIPAGELNQFKLPEGARDYLKNPKLGLSIEDVTKKADFVDDKIAANIDELIGESDKLQKGVLDLEAQMILTEIKDKLVSGELLSNAEKRLYNITAEGFGRKDLSVPLNLKNTKAGSNIDNVTKSPSKDLISEARKYKTADEFVKAQPTLYHGNSTEGAFKIVDQPTFLTSNKVQADKFANDVMYGQQRGGLGRVLEFSAKPGKAKTINIPKDIGYGIDDFVKKQSDIAKKEGYRYVEFKHPTVDMDLGEFPVKVSLYPKEDLLTKSQLTDIWKKANKK